MGVQTDGQLQCLRLASTQQGLVRRDQALGAGFGEDPIAWRLATGRWEALFPGVYRIEGAPRTWLQSLKAACLWAARGVAVSHRAAACLWGLGRFRRESVEISVTRNLRTTGPVRVHRVRELRLKDLGSVDGLPVTTPTRTLIDLCAEEDRQTLWATFDECLRRKLTSLDRLSAALDRSRGARGVAVLRELVERYQGGEAPTESELETRFLEILDAAGVPRPEKQQRILLRGRVRRLDFAYPSQGIVIEVDGYAYHSDPLAFERDHQRRNALTARGFRVFGFTWKAIQERPHAVADEVRNALVH